MVWTGLLARELAIIIGHTYRMSRLDAGFGFGWETGRIARSIATGHGFGSPFQPGTGPTAWLAPVYPYLLAGIFKIFGVYTTAAAVAIFSLNSVFSALTILAVFYIARRTAGNRAAFWCGWLAALFPYAWYAAIRWPWETSLATLLLACVFLLCMRMAGIDISSDHRQVDLRTPDWLLFGALWALIALVNPSLLLWLPFCGIWLMVGEAKIEPPSKAVSRAVAAGLLFVLLVSPWIIRNSVVFHQFIPMRSDFGTELRLGNGDDANGLGRFWLHPANNVLEFKKYKQMGEISYVRSNANEAMAFIRAHPADFAELCVKRAVYFWYGTPRDTGIRALSETRNLGFLLSSILAFAGIWALWRQAHPATFLFASLLFSVPLIYYITFAHPRYRAPIEPEMLVLIVTLVLAAKIEKPARQGT